MSHRFILNIHSPDRLGIVAATTTFLADHSCAITEAHQHQSGGAFFMRLSVDDYNQAQSLDQLRDAFRPVASKFEMSVSFHDAAVRPKLLLLVSRFGHCLEDLLHRWRRGHLAADIIGVVSNHEDMRSFVEWSGLPFHYLPVTKDTRNEQESRIIQLLEENAVDLTVLARYMQILSPRLCAVLAGRCINIHHSFLPSFKGAKPYHQAHARGVKIIGATAHYVTTDLDEGPIIEQDTRRVSHARSPEELVVIGQEVEASVLQRAVRWHIDHRVMMNGAQTVVFE